MLSTQEFKVIKDRIIDWDIYNLQKELDKRGYQMDVSSENYNNLAICFEDISKFVANFMKIPRLDRHKIAVVTTLSVLQCRLFRIADIDRDMISNDDKKHMKPKLYYLANEVLALRVGLNILKVFLQDSIATEYSIRAKVLIDSNIEIKYPNISSDKCSNESNLVGMFYRLSESSKRFPDTNFLHHSFWMLAQIFYYIESYNKGVIIENIDNYRKLS